MSLSTIYTLDHDERSRIMDQFVSELASEPGMAFAYLYGSFVDSEAFRDVDVGVYMRSMAPGEMTTRAMALAQCLSTKVRLPVDVRVLNAAPIPFLYHVLRGHLLLSHDDDLLTEVIERTACRYLDIASLLRSSAREAFAV